MSTGLFVIIGFLLFASGLLLLLGGVVTGLRAHRMYASWASVNGKVTRVVSHAISPTNFHFYPVIAYETKTGKNVDFESGLGFFPAKHQPGQVVTVWYDEGDPGNAMLDLPAAKWTVPLALGIFGVIALFLGGIILALT